MDVFDLVAKLSLDQSEYESGLTDAQSKASGFGSGLKTAMGVGAVAVGAVTTAVAGVTTAFGNGISNLAEYTDHIDKQSQKMNMSAEAYQEWSAVMEHSGTSIDTMQSSMKTLANAVETGNEAFEKLGLTQEELSSMDNEQIFSATITALQNVDDETERTYLAGQLLGRGATELGALLNTSAEDTQAMKDRVKELGGVMSDDAVKAGASFQDSLQDMQTAFTGLKNNMLSDFLPSVTTVMDGLTEIFAGNYDEGIDQITEGISSVIDNISDLIPQMSEVGGGIITALIDALTDNLDSILTAGADVMGQLADAIISNLPTIFDTAGQILLQISEGIISSLPQLASAGVEILVNLANGIANSLPTLIPTVVSVVLQITQTLIEHLPELIQAGISILQGVIEGIVEAIPLVVDALPELIDAILNALVDSADVILDGALTMFMAIVDAIPDIVTALGDAIPEIIDTIVNFLTGDGLPQVLDGAITMLMAIIEAIPSIVSALASSLPSIVTAIVTALINAVPQILSAGITLLSGIVEAIPDVISSLASAIPEIITSIVSSLSEGVSSIRTVGQNLLTGLWNGISDKASWVYSQITSLGSNIITKVKALFGVASPSKVFKEIGGYLAEGLGIGWEEGMDDVNNKIDKDIKYEGEMNVVADANTLSAENTVTAGANKSDVESDQPIIVNVYTTVDGKVIGQTSYQYMKEQMSSDERGLTLAQGGYY